MAFIKRLGFYLAGLSIGLVFLAIFLKKKSEGTGSEFCYLPNCRVLKELRSKPLTYSEPVAEMMRNGKLDSVAIARFLTDGDVDFGKSDTKSEPCKSYSIRSPEQGEQQVLEVRLCPEETIIEGLQ